MSSAVTYAVPYQAGISDGHTSILPLIADPYKPVGNAPVLNGDGSLDVTSTADSASSTSGALVVAGGVGVSKSITAGGSVIAAQFSTTSDARTKQNVVPVLAAMSTLARVSAVQYTLLDGVDDGRKHFGVVAQDLQAVGLEHLVMSDGSGKLSVAYNGLVGLLIGAVNELNTKIQLLEQKRTSTPEHEQ
jgi:hypothetical protein